MLVKEQKNDETDEVLMKHNSLTVKYLIAFFIISSKNRVDKPRKKHAR